MTLLRWLLVRCVWGAALVAGCWAVGRVFGWGMFSVLAVICAAGLAFEGLVWFTGLFEQPE